jgi:hypothetical protein
MNGNEGLYLCRRACGCSSVAECAEPGYAGFGAPVCAALASRHRHTSIRGSGAAQSSMEIFNRTLAADLWRFRLFTLIPRAMYPLSNPQQPADLGDKDGKKLSDWSGPPTHARYSHSATPRSFGTN